MDLVRSSDITHIYTSTLRSRKQTASDPRKVSLASHASNSQLLTRQGRERKFRKVKGHFLDAVPFTPSPLAATFPSSKKARPSFQSWNIGRGCDVARFIAFRIKIEYRISMILRAMACIGLEGNRERKRVSRENVCRPLELDNLRFSRFLFGPKTTLFDNLTPSLHFHSTFLFSPSFLTSFHPVPLLHLNETSLRVARASSFVPRIYVFWRESSPLDWAAVGYDPVHRFFFAIRAATRAVRQMERDCTLVNGWNQPPWRFQTMLTMLPGLRVQLCFFFVSLFLLFLPAYV